MPAPGRSRTRKKLRVIAIGAVLLVAIGFVEHWRESWAREKREAGYRAIVLTYSHELKPGMSRKAVEDYLKTRKIGFDQMCCLVSKTEDYYVDRVKLGEESPPWYCEGAYVYVAFDFFAVERHEGPSLADDSDVLRKVELYQLAGACL